MNKEVEFYFDVGSPASYLAWTQLPAIATGADASIVYRPLLLGGVFQSTGNASPMNVAAKGRWMQGDLARFAARYRVPFAHNPYFPINTLMLMRGATAVQLKHPERFVPFVDAVYRSIWVDGRNMNDGAVVAGVLEQAGFDAATVMSELTDPEVKAALKKTTDDAVARGVFGAPTMFVDGAMYFGQDRLDFVREALEH